MVKSLEICPVCQSNAQFEALNYYRVGSIDFNLFECSRCLVRFWQPLKSPGATWYEQSDYHNVKFGKPRCLHSYHKEFLKRHPVFNKGVETLDLGCGTGEFVEELKKRGASAWGVDFDKEAIAIAKEYFKNENYYALALNDFFKKETLPSFDFITAFEVIEHLDNPWEIIKEAHRILNPGGSLIISMPSRERPLVNSSSWDFPFHHLSRWNEKAVKNILYQAGFNQVEVKYINKFNSLYEFFLEFIASKVGFKRMTKLSGVKKLSGSSRDSLIKKIKNGLIKIIYNITRWIGVYLIPYALTIIFYPIILIFYKKYGVMYIEGKVNKY